MFRKNKVPQRKEFKFTSEQIIEDIKNIANDEEQRDKLFMCIDDKIPESDSKFVRLNEFLEGNNNLEEVSASLRDMCDNLKDLNKELLTEGARITKMAKDALEIVNEN